MDHNEKIAELRKLRAKVASLEIDLAVESAQQLAWPPDSYYTTYHILAGMVLGVIGAASSLIFNIVGSAMVGNHPLQLIRIYLTFPLGEKALEQNSGFALAAGCCLYLATGMIGGIPFHLVLSRYFAHSATSTRFVVTTILSLGVWLINYYGVLVWLQPALIGGRWIVDQIPVLIAILTHLVFGWTLLLVDQWGQFVPPAAPMDGTAEGVAT